MRDLRARRTEYLSAYIAQASVRAIPSTAFIGISGAFQARLRLAQFMLWFRGLRVDAIRFHAAGDVFPTTQIQPTIPMRTIKKRRPIILVLLLTGLAITAQAYVYFITNGIHVEDPVTNEDVVDTVVLTGSPAITHAGSEQWVDPQSGIFEDYGHPYGPFPHHFFDGYGWEIQVRTGWQDPMVFSKYKSAYEDWLYEDFGTYNGSILFWGWDPHITTYRSGSFNGLGKSVSWSVSKIYRSFLESGEYTDDETGDHYESSYLQDAYNLYYNISMTEFAADTITVSTDGTVVTGSVDASTDAPFIVSRTMPHMGVVYYADVTGQPDYDSGPVYINVEPQVGGGGSYDDVDVSWNGGSSLVSGTTFTGEFFENFHVWQRVNGQTTAEEGPVSWESVNVSYHNDSYALTGRGVLWYSTLSEELNAIGFGGGATKNRVTLSSLGLATLPPGTPSDLLLVTYEVVEHQPEIGTDYEDVGVLSGYWRHIHAKLGEVLAITPVYQP
ncbi:MAG: hypothetical protein AB1705_05700 [Verrucomicrobiota bacterium]